MAGSVTRRPVVLFSRPIGAYIASSSMFDAAAAAGIPPSDREIASAEPVGPPPPAAPDHPGRRGPREPRYTGPPPARTFARLVGFDLACPNCGAVDCVRSASGLPWWKGARRFDSWRSRWRCRACRRVFVVGLAIWPARRTGNAQQRPFDRPLNDPGRDSRPADTIPSRAQIEELNELHGLVRAQARGWREPVNLICICGSTDDDHRPDCPLNEDGALVV